MQFYRAILNSSIRPSWFRIVEWGTAIVGFEMYSKQVTGTSTMNESYLKDGVAKLLILMFYFLCISLQEASVFVKRQAAGSKKLCFPWLSTFQTKIWITVSAARFSNLQPSFKIRTLDVSGSPSLLLTLNDTNTLWVVLSHNKKWKR